MKALNGYVAFLDGKRAEVWAETLYRAKLAAARMFGVAENSKAYLKIAIMLARRADGSDVIHIADF